MHSHVGYGVLALPRFSLAHLGQLRHLVPLGFVGLISWSVWLLRFTLSRVYRPLSGRTVAYRRHVVLPVLEHLEDEFFLGRRCLAGMTAG